MPNELDALIATVATDEHVRARLIRLVDTVLDETEYLLEHGTPSIKTSIMRSIITAAVRELKQGDTEDAERLAMRAELKQLMQEVRNASPRALPTGESTPIAEDMPPTAS